MSDDADLAGLEAERARLYAELSGTGDFRRGRLSAVFRKCGKPNCRCAQPGDRGHGPQWNWVWWAGGKTVTVHPRPGPELEKAQRESAQWERFRELTGRIEAVNEAICDAAAWRYAILARRPLTRRGKKGRLSQELARRLAAEAAAEVTRLAAAAAASIGGGGGLERAWRTGEDCRSWLVSWPRCAGLPDRSIRSGGRGSSCHGNTVTARVRRRQVSLCASTR